MLIGPDNLSKTIWHALKKDHRTNGGARNDGWATTLTTGLQAKKNSNWAARGFTTKLATVRGTSICVLRNRHDRHSSMWWLLAVM